MELARLFVDLMVGAKVRVGSLILLSSVSNLAAVGTAAYAEALVRAGSHVGQSMQGKVTVRGGVPIFLGGAEGLSLVRSLHEVVDWTGGLPAASDQFPANARQAFLLTLKNNGVGSTVQVENFVLQLPVSLNSFEKKNFVSNGWDCVYAKINPFSEADKNSLLTLYWLKYTPSSPFQFHSLSYTTEWFRRPPQVTPARPSFWLALAIPGSSLLT
jgi:hypothetical protein